MGLKKSIAAASGKHLTDEYAVMVVLVNFFQVSTFCEKLKPKQNLTKSSQLPPLPLILVGDGIRGR